MGQQRSYAPRSKPVLPGVFRQAMPALVKRSHQTESPWKLCGDGKIVEPGGIILDPLPVLHHHPCRQAGGLSPWASSFRGIMPMSRKTHGNHRTCRSRLMAPFILNKGILLIQEDVNQNRSHQREAQAYRPLLAQATAVTLRKMSDEEHAPSRQADGEATCPAECRT